jgi:hypothetical protein
MKINLSLKDTHLDTIDDLKKKYSISSNEEIVKICLKSALQLQNDDLIFGSEREHCTGGCFSSEPQFQIEIDGDEFNKLKKVFQNYNFSEYDTEEEEISKTIRCIINFFEEEPDSISI